MKTFIWDIATFNTEAEAMSFIEREKLDNVIVDRNLFTGKYHVLDLNGARN